MDASTAVIIALFVVTIFSSFGSVSSPNTPQTNRPQPRIVRQADPQPTYQGTLAPGFNALSPSSAKLSINKFVLKYRKEWEASAITDAIMAHAQTYDVNPKLVAALIARESRFNPQAVSSSGALGLGQLLPSTAKGLGVDNGFDIDQNVRGTVRYMKYLLDRFKKYNEQISFAIAGYLEGPNAVERNKGYSSHTQSYINDIIDYYNKI